jgi:transcriptional regulator with XRE-family HTH domain
MTMSKNHAEQQYLIRLGQHVRKLRLEQSISQEALAEKAGVHRTYVGMIERGEKNITVLSILKISAALGKNISDFFEVLEDGT